MKKIKTPVFKKIVKKNYEGCNFSFPIKNLKITNFAINYMFLVIKKYFITENENNNYVCMIYIMSDFEVLSLGPAFIWNKYLNIDTVIKKILGGINDKIFQIYRWKKIDYIIFTLTKWQS